MYFKKLEIIGFKSFFNKTTLHFEPGITAVVGPNGCGKSNIFDSIRWVLGEQSVKSLRGSKMEDVIFNGTDKKEPLSLAEVSLTFSNEAGIFPIADKEFVITRRIFRSGESEYLLNKVMVRLKDINELFMGTGVGAEAYSLVEQGKIDLILSSRPEDRRMVFDEASGITKYKAQKKEALRKLEETEQNLLRISDITAEVKRQIGSLERQANKARRYKEVFEELKSKEATLAALDSRAIVRQKDRLLDRIKESEQAQENNYNTIGETDLRIKEENGKLKSLEDKVMEIKGQIMNIDGVIARNTQHIKLNKEREEELEALRRSLNEQIAQAEKRIETDMQKLESHKIEFSSIRQTRDEKENLRRQTQEKQEDILRAMKASTEKIAQAKTMILELANKRSLLKNDILDLTAKMQSLLAREKRLDIEKAKVLQEKVSVEGAFATVTAELNSLKRQFEESCNQLSADKKACEEENNTFEALKLEIQELEKNKAKLLSQKDFLEKLKLKYEEEAEAMNVVVLIEGVPQEDLSGIVVKIRQVEKSGAADRQLFDKADYKLTGEAKPIPLDTQAIDRKINEVSAELESKSGQRLIRENTLRELTARIAAEEQDSRELEILFNNKKAQQENISGQLAKINEEQGIVDLELSDVRQELEGLTGVEKELNASMALLEAQNKAEEDLIQKEQFEISALNARREENRVLITQIETELQSIGQRVSSEGETLKMLEEACAQDKNTLGDFQAQIKDSQVKSRLLEKEIGELEKSNTDEALNRRKAQETLSELEVQDRKIFVNLEEDNKLLQQQRQLAEDAKGQLYNLQMQNQEMDFKLSAIRDRLRQAYKVELEAVPENQEQVSGVEITADSLSLQIQALKDKLDSYGTVNLVAIEEYDELKTRYDFLNQQQSDLFTAKESLHEAITKINRTTRKMFVETFEKIVVEFRNRFRLLFGGGDASIFLIDESDPLESGIEIICRPPGKKLQNVLLLSGGEKTMSAIALLFAIFKVKPSPFCVLDEIDAALDEANVDRYGRMLQEFARQSQFIVITHNKRTIASADIMYGITMEESGVSKIVSVKFSKDKVKEEPAEEASAVAA